MSVPSIDARDVDVADVYKAGHHAATLRRTPEGIEFCYLDTYLASALPPVALSLPTDDAPTTTPAGAVPPFFAGLLPEGRRLANLRNAVKTSADDELSLVVAAGHDPIGDVQVVPAGLPAARGAPLIEVTKSFDEIRFGDLLENAGIIDPSALPGVQAKASARGLSLPVGSAGDRFILKIDPPEHPHIVANEAYFLELSRAAGIPTADAEVVHDIDGRPGLLVRRFDRVAQADGTAAPLACEDACQALGRWPADKYQVSSEAVVTVLANACAARPLAIRDVVRLLVFGYLTGNGDIHAKNVSVLQDESGEWRVAPAYDLPSTLLYGDTTLALPIGHDRVGISRRKVLAFAESVGLKERAAARVLDDLIDATARVIDDLRSGALPFGQQTIADATAELRNRRRLLKG